MSTNLSQKIPPIFTCSDCDYNTSVKKDFQKHLETQKHKINILSTKSTFCQHKNPYTCLSCNKSYSERSGLWRHKKKCPGFIENKEVLEEELTDKDLIMMLIKENSELKNMMMKVLENGTNNNTNTNINNNTMTNSNNKSFNLNVFLNETCKDAMNISDFVSSIKVNLEDLENTARQGYVQGISDIFLKNLNNLENHMRPLHCSDLKREILYIKDNDKWEKETLDKPILINAIKTVAHENIKQIKIWKENNPGCTLSDSKKNNFYLKILSNSMNGVSDEESKKNISRIISNLAKEVTIDKVKMSMRKN